MDKSTADANALLAKNNSPQQITSPGGSVKDILYALGGYSPASVLNAQGVAQQTAAAQQPITSRGLGIDAAKAAMNVGATNARDLRNQLADIQSKRPGLISQALSGIQQSQGNAYSQFIQGQYLQNSLRSTGAGITGVDPVTNQPTFAATSAKAAAAAKSAATHASAVGKRDDGTVKALAGAHDWVEKQLKPGTQQAKIADVPIKVGTIKIGKVSLPTYVTAPRFVGTKDAQGNIVGKTTTETALAVSKPVYAQIPLPKPQFDLILRQVTGRLKAQLGRYGYKPAQIRAFAQDIVDDYYSVELKAKKDFVAGLAAENKRRAK